MVVQEMIPSQQCLLELEWLPISFSIHWTPYCLITIISTPTANKPIRGLGFCSGKPLVDVGHIVNVYFINNVSVDTFKISEKIMYKSYKPKVHQAESSKFLGLYIDEKLNWKLHISYLAGKIARGVGENIKSKEIFYQWLFGTII